MTYRSVINALTRCATLLSNNFRKENINDILFDLLFILIWSTSQHGGAPYHLKKNAVRKSKGEGAGHGRSSQSNWALLFQTSLTSSIILKFVEEVVECPTFNLLFQSPQKYIQTMQEPKLHISHCEVCEICTHETWMSDEINLQPSEQLLLSLPCFFEKLLVWKWLDFRCI